MRRGVHWTVKTNHRLRTGSFALIFSSVAFHGWDKGYSPILWGLIIAAAIGLSPAGVLAVNGAQKILSRRKSTTC